MIKNIKLKQELKYKISNFCLIIRGIGFVKLYKRNLEDRRVVNVYHQY